MHWDYEPSPTSPQLYHIHGEKDKVIPLRKGAKANVVIPGGSHEIIVNEMGQITKLVEDYIRSLHSF